MNKLFILSAFSALLAQSSLAAPVVQVTATAPAVTVTAGVADNIGGGYYVSSAQSNVSSKASSSGSSIASTASSSGSLNITKDQFIKAWTNSKQYFDANISTPTDAQYNAFINNAASKGGIESKTELAMFLAEIMWESGGLVYKAELACKDNNCAGSYQDSTGISGKYYYGRGYIQLTWGANYKAASTALFNDDRLLQNPEQVATNEDYAWDVSFWFWKVNVKPTLKGTNNFGLATKAINGALECSGGVNDKAQKRYKIYVEILKVFEPSATPIESGCYN
jgi:chitinase